MHAGIFQEIRTGNLIALFPAPFFLPGRAVCPCQGKSEGLLALSWCVSPEIACLVTAAPCGADPSEQMVGYLSLAWAM